MTPTHPTSAPVNRNRRRVVTTLAAAPLLGFPAIVRAQAKRLTIVLTVPPGTSSDVLARTLGEQIRTRMDRQVVVESKPGASGLIAGATRDASEAVAQLSGEA